MENFNIFGQVKSELKDFFEKKIKIGSAVVDGKEIGGYEYSQWELLQTIEYMDNSKFLSGDRDSEGQQKFYLNMATFRRETASKNIDIDVSNFKFIPEEGSSEFSSIIARKKFRKWAKDRGLSKLLNESVDRFPKYGTIVMKRVGREVEIVPLLKLRNQQDAKSLEDASYVIVEHSNLQRHELEEKKGWDLTQLDLKFNDTLTVYERYGYVPRSLLKSEDGEVKTDSDERVYAVAIIALDHVKKGGGAILFIEETDCPFIEEHYSRQDGRWLGIGEMEKQIENQAARNMVFNLRKKSLAWSVKNIFQTQDDTIINNLVKEVRDGDVLKVSTPNGIYRVDTVNRAAGDYNSMDQLIEENSNQRSFTFEAATGEAFKSGTPFRLGALLTNSVNSYYDKKKEQLAIFWKDVILNYWIPTWEKETEEEFIEGVCDTEEGYEELRGAKKELIKAQAIIRAIIEGAEVEPEGLELLADTTLKNAKTDYYRMTKDELKNMKYRFDIDITGESIDVAQKVETLTTLYQAQAQMGDIEGAKATIKRIMILTGEKIPKASSSNVNMAQQGMGGTPTQMPTGEQALAPAI